MIVHVQVISEQLSKPSSADWNDLDQETLTTLVTLLSHSLQAAVTNNGFTPEMSNSADITQALGSDSHDGNFRNAIAPSSGCIPDSSSGVYIQRGRSISTKQTVQLVADILQTASDLMLVRENHEKHFLVKICSSTYLHICLYWQFSSFSEIPLVPQDP